MAAGLTLGHVSTHHSRLEIVWVSAACAAITVYLLVLLYYVLKDRHLVLMGYLSQLPAVFIMLFLPYNWYTSVGGYGAIRASYLKKTRLPVWAYILILISALALRPTYPLLLGVSFGAQMLAEVERINAERGGSLQIGMGIDYGEVVFAPVGSAIRLEYTAIGDAANTASRIESATKQCNVPIPCSESVRAALPAHKGYAAMAQALLPGKAERVSMFTLSGTERFAAKVPTGRKRLDIIS